MHRVETDSLRKVKPTWHELQQHTLLLYDLLDQRTILVVLHFSLDAIARSLLPLFFCPQGDLLRGRQPSQWIICIGQGTDREVG